MFRGRRALLLTGAVVFAVCGVRAHDLGQSESIFEPRGNAVAATVTVDLLGFTGVDDDANGRVSYDELDTSIADVFAQLKTHLRVQAAVPPLRITLDRHELIEDDHVLRMNITYAFREPVKAVTVTSSLDQLANPTHQHLVTSVVDGERRRAVLDRTNPSVTIALTNVRFTVTRVVAALAGLIGVAVAVWLRSRRRDSR
jgi:hypothetical protein